MADDALTNLRVLLVDDNEHTLELIQRMLRGLGVRRVRCARTVLDALALLRRESADLLITDLAMEPLDGLALIKHLRTAPDSPAPKLPILMLSAHNESEKVVAARSAGANGFLIKPVSPRALLQHILRLCPQR